MPIEIAIILLILLVVVMLAIVYDFAYNRGYHDGVYNLTEDLIDRKVVKIDNSFSKPRLIQYNN